MTQCESHEIKEINITRHVIIFKIVYDMIVEAEAPVKYKNQVDE